MMLTQKIKWTRYLIVLVLVLFVFSINTLAQTDKPMEAKALAALIAELKGIVSKTAPDKNEAKSVGEKWDARKDLAGKTKSEVIELLFEDVKSVIKDSGTQYQIYSTFSFYKNIDTDSSDFPADIADWGGQDSDKILENPAIKMRLKKLLGDEDFVSFSDHFETKTPTEKTRNFLFASGCMIRACTRLESAVAIDLANKTIHAAIYNEIEETKYFNEKNSKTPEPIIKWAKRLEELKGDTVENQSEAILVDSFGYANREDMMLRIDNFTVQMQNDSTLKGYIITKGNKSARTVAEKEIKSYLKMRAFDMKNFVFLNGEGEKTAEVELWLVPPGAKPPAIERKNNDKKETSKVQPKIFVVFQMEVHDAEMYEQYRITVEPLLKKYGGRYLVRSGGLSYDDDPDTKLTLIEGDWNPDRLIIIQWDSMEQLQKFVKSAEYLKIVGLREKSATTKTVLVKEYLKN